ncbi:hypothetical protein FOCC_FOCC006883 [Frankliniella occidentalis]|nr:hypothetical protein FOCC_FOCC006883 [Frankliniella occidentalis]
MPARAAQDAVPAATPARKKKKLKFDLDLPQVMKVESHHDDAVLDSRGSRGSMQKVPSLSDLSDPESSLGKSNCVHRGVSC